MPDEQPSNPSIPVSTPASAPPQASAPAAKPTAAPAAAASAKPAAPAAPATPPPPPVPNPLPHVPLPFKGTDFQLKGFNAEAVVQANEVVTAAREMDKAGFALDTITGVDWMAENQMEVIYDYFHPAKQLRAAIRARISRQNPEIATISEVFPGANWHERETHDFFGIRFAGHPNLQPFLLPEDSTYHPLRKDFKS
jgi:NADH-quinone oxidoreductase subunit C